MIFIFNRILVMSVEISVTTTQIFWNFRQSLLWNYSRLKKSEEHLFLTLSNIYFLHSRINHKYNVFQLFVSATLLKVMLLLNIKDWRLGRWLNLSKKPLLNYSRLRKMKERESSLAMQFKAGVERPENLHK